MIRSHLRNQPSIVGTQYNRNGISPQTIYSSKNIPACQSGKFMKTSKQLYLGLRSANFSPARELFSKENYPINQNTPKQYEYFEREINIDDVDQLSQIKFISKECSSIKDNPRDLDYISETTLDHQFQDFSPLFDKIDRKDSDRDDFVLQIYDIEEDTSHDSLFNASSRNSIRSKQQKNIQPKMQKIGKIKKNKADHKIASSNPKIASKTGLDSYIQDIFDTLDSSKSKVLQKHNCESDRLSTELNYLIGSLLNKIKVKGKQYKYNQFEEQFKSLIQDSDQQELKYILTNNKKKIEKNKQNVNNQQKEGNSRTYFNSKIEPISPNFKQIGSKSQPNKQGILSEKLSKINEKVNLYLLKNNLATDYVQQTIGSSSKIQNKNSDFKNMEALSQQKKSNGYSTYRDNNESSFEQMMKVEVSLRNDYDVIQGIEGSSFELNFSQLNKHL